MPYAMPSPLPQPLSFPLPSSSPFSPSTSMTPPKSPEFVFTSNTSLAPLQGVPRSNKASKIKLQSRSHSTHHPATLPRSIPPIPFPTVQPPTPDAPTRQSITPLSESYPLRPKRVRGQRTSPTRAFDSASHSSSDSDDGPLPSDALTIGRKRGELLSANRRSLSSSAALAVPSPVPAITSAPSTTTACAPPTKKFQAVVAGQSGVLKLNMDAIKRARAQKEGVTHDDITTKPKYNTFGPSSTNLIRKKSGELVKPALRHTTSSFSTSPDAETSYPPASSTGEYLRMNGSRMPKDGNSSSAMYRRNSAPSTPSNPKAVKFDSQLEHVKLFLAEQKPAAVSRDGSPQCSTTEDESMGYPWYSRKKSEGKLSLKVVDGSENGCATEEERGRYSKALDRPGCSGVDVKMESLVLSDDGKCLKGSVVVKNLAFDKWVAARFTLDWWQTTSEVTGRYVESVSRTPSPHSALDAPTTHDRFTFMIKLDDVLAKIEEKTMFIAIRYCAAGKEMWDNNLHRNYQVLFERVKGSTVSGPGSPTKNGAKINATGAGSPTKTKGGWPEMADLRRELEKVVNEDLSDDAKGRRPLLRKVDGPKAFSFSGPLPSNNSSPSLSPLPLPKSTTVANPPTLNQQLSSRYDFASSLNSTWNPSKALDLAATQNRYQKSWNPPPLPTGMPNTQKAATANAATGSVKKTSPNGLDVPHTLGPAPSEGVLFPARSSASPSPSPTRGNSPTKSMSPNMRVVFPATSGFSTADGSKPALGSPRDRYGSHADIDAAKIALSRRMSDEDEDADDKRYTFAFTPSFEEDSRSMGRGRRHRRSPSSYFDGWLGSQSSFVTGNDKIKPRTFSSMGSDIISPTSISLSLASANTADVLVSRPGDESEDHEEDGEEVGNYTLVNVCDDPRTSEEEEETEREQDKEVYSLLGLKTDSAVEGRSGLNITTPSVSVSASSPPVSANNTPLSHGFYSATMLGAGGLQPYNTVARPEVHSPTGFSSTPSITSSTSTSPTQSSSSLPVSPTNSDMDVSSIFTMQGNGGNRDSQYNFFVDRFCFFTGDMAEVNAASGDSPLHPPRRIHSDSDVDSYFSHSVGGPTGFGMYGSPPMGSEEATFGGAWSSYFNSSSFGSATSAGYSSGHTTPTRSPKAEVDSPMNEEDMDMDAEVSTTPRPGTPVEQPIEGCASPMTAIPTAFTASTA
ncbi:hypothetical protein FRC02_011654 [Tulasnella sp. 418]|nr:hypothetical protein FRC02_011654 [Tulasnella sp. 418]